MSELTREQVEQDMAKALSGDPGYISASDRVLETDAALRATIEQQAQEITRLEGLCTERLAQGQHLHDQLAASQARCREMEELEFQTRQQITEWALELDHEDGIVSLGKLKEMVQATLAAREAELVEAHTFRDAAFVARPTYEKAVREAEQLQLTWTTARPMVIGDYYWQAPRFGPEVQRIDLLNGPDTDELAVDGCPWEEFIAQHPHSEWSDKPIPLPTEAQQARGSSGGAANHYGAGA